MEQPRRKILVEGKTTFANIWRWGQQFTCFHARIAPHFARPEPCRRALLYLQGLLSPLEVKA